MTDLTSNVPKEQLAKTTVMGRTVYVSEKTEDAYVEFQDELVSITNLQAWNALMEKGKQDVLDHYDEEQTLAEKELEEHKEHLASDLRDMAVDLQRKADSLHNVGELE